MINKLPDLTDHKQHNLGWSDIATHPSDKQEIEIFN